MPLRQPSRNATVIGTIFRNILTQSPMLQTKK